MTTSRNCWTPSSRRWPAHSASGTSPKRTTTWIRPEVQRGLEADCCYYLLPEKIETARAALKARLKDQAAHYPNPDLAIEVDISRLEAGIARAIYAALEVTELWIFDGAKLLIKRLGDDRRYHTVEASGFCGSVLTTSFAGCCTKTTATWRAWSHLHLLMGVEQIPGEEGSIP